MKERLLIPAALGIGSNFKNVSSLLTTKHSVGLIPTMVLSSNTNVFPAPYLLYSFKTLLCCLDRLISRTTFKPPASKSQTLRPQARNTTPSFEFLYQHTFAWGLVNNKQGITNLFHDGGNPVPTTNTLNLDTRIKFVTKLFSHLRNLAISSPPVNLWFKK